WEEAQKLYEAILPKHPESAEAYYGLGRVRAARQQLPEAIDSFRKACELFPKFSAAHFALARAYRRAGRADQAERELELSKNSGGGPAELEDPRLADGRELYRDYRTYLWAGAQFAEGGQLQAATEAIET